MLMNKVALAAAVLLFLWLQSKVYSVEYNYLLFHSYCAAPVGYKWA